MSLRKPISLSFRTVSTSKESVQSSPQESPEGMERSRDFHIAQDAERVEEISIEEDTVISRVDEDRSPARKKTIEEVLLEIDHEDVESIELRPNTKEVNDQASH